MLKVKRPVTILLVLTPTLQTKMQQEYQGYIRRYELEIEQLQFQSKKLLQEAAKRGIEAQRLVQERLGKEEKLRREKVIQYKEMLAQLERLPIGSEIEHSSLETEVEVEVGDHWDKLIGKYEIVVKDGIIIEVRNGVNQT
ncbi:MAG TPA: YlqD family protein [Bacillota bacterium]|nr:YlqD family protein [Bacillota bacterium]